MSQTEKRGPLVKVTGVSKRYGDRAPVLSNISFEVFEGDTPEFLQEVIDAFLAPVPELRDQVCSAMSDQGGAAR